MARIHVMSTVTYLTCPQRPPGSKNAREVASAKVTKAGDMDRAERIRQFQFRDRRSNAASEINNTKQASKPLGHSQERITRQAYRPVGERAKPTRSPIVLGMGWKSL